MKGVTQNNDYFLSNLQLKYHEIKQTIGLEIKIRSLQNAKSFLVELLLMKNRKNRRPYDGDNMFNIWKVLYDKDQNLKKMKDAKVHEENACFTHTKDASN